jgi:hypothetical protein
LVFLFLAGPLPLEGAAEDLPFLAEGREETAVAKLSSSPELSEKEEEESERRRRRMKNS